MYNNKKIFNNAYMILFIQQKKIRIKSHCRKNS